MARIRDLKSDGNFQVLYGEDEESDTPLAGFSEGTLFTGPAVEGATQIPVASIYSGFPIGPDGPSWRDRMRSAWRYWDGNFDLGFNATQATVDTTGLLSISRRHEGRTRRASSWRKLRYATQTDHRLVPSTGIRRIPRNWRGRQHDKRRISVRHRSRREYDILTRLYAFGWVRLHTMRFEVEYPRHTEAGRGYLFWEQVLDEDRATSSPRSRRRLGCLNATSVDRNGDNDYFAIAFSAVPATTCRTVAHFDGRVDYLRR